MKTKELTVSSLRQGDEVKLASGSYFFSHFDPTNDYAVFNYTVDNVSAQFSTSSITRDTPLSQVK